MCDCHVAGSTSECRILINFDPSVRRHLEQQVVQWLDDVRWSFFRLPGSWSRKSYLIISHIWTYQNGKDTLKGTSFCPTIKLTCRMSNRFFDDFCICLFSFQLFFYFEGPAFLNLFYTFLSSRCVKRSPPRTDLAWPASTVVDHSVHCQRPKRRLHQAVTPQRIVLEPWARWFDWLFWRVLKIMEDLGSKDVAYDEIHVYSNIYI